MYARVAERRPLGAIGRMGIVVGMHAALLVLVARSMGVTLPKVDTPPDIKATIDKPEQRVDVQPNIPDPQPYLWHDEIKPPPTAEFEQDPPPPEGGLTNTGGETGGGTGTIQPPIPFEGARLDARHPLTQPLYPPGDRRDGHEGSADLEIYVLPNGRIGDARVARSSGFPGLDNAAIEEAKKNWRLIPASKGGEAIASWYRLRVVFKLRNS